LFVRDEERDPKQLKGKQGAPAQWSDKQVLEQMSIITGFATPKLAKRLAEEKGMSRATFYRLLAKLEDQGKVERREDGLWYRVSQSSSHSETAETSETNQSHNHSETGEML
jgi:Fe2+ or Zn2+ uptake regulation protein